MALATLTLEPGAFFDVLNKHIPIGKVDWSSDNHFTIVTETRERLRDPDGNPVNIPASLNNVIRLIFKPTEDVQMEVLREQFAAAGYVLSAEAKKAFEPMLNAAQFGKLLAQKVNPKTGKPFIVIEKKRGAKKSAFDSLFTAATPAPEAPPAPEVKESEQPANTGNVSDDAVEVAITEILPPPPKATPAKPSTSAPEAK
jgi:hypothetical protein